ncbi:MAG: sigma 54-interacting transcriptional regulator [Polyangiaceae bacterium]
MAAAATVGDGGVSMASDQHDDGGERSSTETFFGPPEASMSKSPAGVSILFFHRGGVEDAHLGPGESLIVGRHSPSDVRIPDRSVSSKHARLTLRDGQVLVEDLGSHNGLWIGGKRVTSCHIPASGEVMLGTAIARLSPLEPSAPPAVVPEEEFSKELEAEVSRAEHLARSFSVLALRASRAEAERGKQGSWVTGLRDQLTRFQRVKRDGPEPEIALILLPEANEQTALETARRLAAGSGAPGDRRCVGVAVYPRDATSPHKLLDKARAALERATAEQSVVLAGAVRGTEGDASADKDPIIGASQRELYKDAKRMARVPFPVLIQGESGTGKEVLARFIHDNGPRRKKPYIAVNCGIWTESLLETRLFGHEKGAFTGAAQTRKGIFEDANGGTLFLDEIGELKLDAQASLLRVIEEQTVMRAGSTTEIKVDVRILAATNRDLKQMSEEGRFREDLYYRLHVLALEVPPLRERRDEIDLLVERFVRQSNQAQHSGPPILGVSPEAMAMLRAYSWPGNVRELRNAIQRAVVLAEEWIHPEDLPATVRRAWTDAESSKGPAESSKGPAPAPDARRVAKEDRASRDLKTGREAADKQLIEDALRKAKNQTEAAKLLGITTRTLRRKMEQLGLKGRKKGHE